jgi:hypothetical protein
MKLRILSDIHLEFDPQWKLRHYGEDAILCAGDLGSARARHLVEALIAGSQVDFYYTPGNHDFYHGQIGETHAFYRSLEKRYTRFHYLVNQTADLGPYVLAATPLYTDFALNGPGTVERSMQIARNCINDFNHMVGVEKEGPGGIVQKWLEPADLLPWHREARTFLAGVVAQGRPTIVMTHWCPAKETISPQYAGDPANPYFTCDVTELMGPPVVLWVHGHSHSYDDRVIKGTRVLRNPLGYPHERQGREDLVVEMG